MLRLCFIVFVNFFLLSHNIFANESSLTIQQQLERLQREVSDLSKSVYSNNNTILEDSSNNDFVTNLSAIDMRIYDLEKDVKNLTGSLEEIFFQIDDIINKLENFDEIFVSLENKLIEIKSNNLELDKQSQSKSDLDQENTLGSLKITPNDSEIENTESINNEDKEAQIEKLKSSPEDQFQSAFDNIREKNWEEAKNSLIKFINDYPENQLSGSAHYWLGELYILEKKYRDAALIFAEGYQKFPDSIKAPDMLYKLSQSLNEVNKSSESCKTLEKLIIDYPNNKYIKNAKKQIQELNCLESIE